MVSPRRDVAEAERVLVAPGGVLLEGEYVLAGAHDVGAHVIVRMTLGFTVGVDQDLLAILAHPPARVDRVLLPRLVAGVVDVTAVLHGHAAVVLLHAADDLPLQLLGERPVARTHRLVVGPLSLEVAEDVGPGAGVISQPVVGVVARPVGGNHFVGPYLGHRRLRGGFARRGAGAAADGLDAASVARTARTRGLIQP